MSTSYVPTVAQLDRMPPDTLIRVPSEHWAFKFVKLPNGMWHSLAGNLLCTAEQTRERMLMCLDPGRLTVEGLPARKLGVDRPGKLR